MAGWPPSCAFRPQPSNCAARSKNLLFEELARQEAAHGFIERPETAEKFFRKGEAGQWQEALSQAQVAAVVSAHAPMMMRFGYLQEDCGVEL